MNKQTDESMSERESRIKERKKKKRVHLGGVTAPPTPPSVLGLKNSSEGGTKKRGDKREKGEERVGRREGE